MAAATADTVPTKVAWEVVITRVLDAPRELVWKVWSEPEHVMHWLGPKNFTPLEFEMDPQPGGKWRARMRSPDGTVYANGGITYEAVEPERLVFGLAWENEDGSSGGETLVTVILAERDGKTEMTFTQAGFASVEERDGHQGGWNESFDKLAEYLASIHKIA